MAFVLLSLKSSPIAGRNYSTESPPISAVMYAGRTRVCSERIRGPPPRHPLRERTHRGFRDHLQPSTIRLDPYRPPDGLNDDPSGGLQPRSSHLTALSHRRGQVAAAHARSPRIPSTTHAAHSSNATSAPTRAYPRGAGTAPSPISHERSAASCSPTPQYAS